MSKVNPSKGQVLAMACAVLIAFSGAAGITVSIQSAISQGPSLDIDDTAEADITVSGAPFNVTINRGADHVFATGVWTVRNKGGRPAMVKIILDNTSFVGRAGVPSAMVIVRETIEPGKGLVPASYLQHRMNHKEPAESRTFRLEPDEEKSLNYVIAGHGTETLTASLGTYSMNLKFDYASAAPTT
ncbi:hypothetical protein V3C41_00560 [Paenarthrobacter nicotinovorans]|uniref:DUF4352 domain-containing protein n=1 Tax=Paenarthrobacter nicotinovorans TaxID=29320 RepID=A0ABV0GM07_PAENI